VNGERAIFKVDRYPDVFGLDIPECIMREAYIMNADITPRSGWETGRESQPALTNSNIRATCDNSSELKTVIYQMDTGNPMNVHSLLMAYAEASVKPVVSDFDTFTVGSRGMRYETISQEQQKLARWSLDCTEEILKFPGESSWLSRWFALLEEANSKGYHPTIPQYGFGDSTSVGVVEALVHATMDSGAVRHGSECFNYYTPQELDDHYLVIWEGFEDKPWRYLAEEALRNWLLQRIREGFSFPLNPVWPVSDDGWFTVWEELWQQNEIEGTCQSWYPPESGIKERVDAIRREFPKGFQRPTPALVTQK